jgi:hypothetical protein
MIVICTCLAVALARSQSSGVDRAKREDDIREAVFRYQMEGWAQEGDKSQQETKDERDKAIAEHLNSRKYVLSINGKDPSDEFMKRFQGILLPVKKVSEVEMNSKESMSVTDKETHKPAIVFSADQVHWLNDNSVEVDGGYHCGLLCAGGFVFKVHLTRGKWVVKRGRMKWIS